jgi:hypothetical protein
LTKKANVDEHPHSGPTQKTRVSSTGSGAGFVAGADATGTPAREDVDLDVVAAEIARHGAVVAGTAVGDPAGFAEGSALTSPARAGTAMPAASLATGATDFELTPAERVYYERYRRYREAKP